MRNSYYSTNELLEVLGEHMPRKYSGRQALLKALRNNEEKDIVNRDSFLSAIWNTRERFGRVWYFKKDKVIDILDWT